MMGEAVRFINRCWREEGGRPLRKSTWGALKKRFIKDKDVPALDAWGAIFEEYIIWLRAYNFIDQMVFFDAVDKNPLQACRISICAVIISISDTLKSAAARGHDIPARHLVRSLREYVDTLALLKARPELCEEFKKTQDEDSANAFWHKYISKNKARKFVDAARKERLGEIFPEEILNWRKQEDSMMAMASHPSYAAGYMILMPNVDIEPEGSHTFFGFMGIRSEMCVRPMAYALISMFELLLSCSIDVVESVDISDSVLNSFVEYVRRGQIVLLRLVLYAVEHQREGELGVRQPPNDADVGD